MNPEAVHQEEYRGLTIALYADDNPTSPADWDTLATMHELGRADYAGWEDGDSRAREALDRGGWALLARYLSVCHGQVAVPVDVQSQSYTTCRAMGDGDRCNAYAETTHERVTELCGEDAKYHKKYSWIVEALAGEVATWNSYFGGEVVGYVVHGADGEYLESCWGFYPDTDKSWHEQYAYVVEDAQGAANLYADERDEAERDERSELLGGEAFAFEELAR